MLVNILSGTGLFLSAKVSSPWQTGVFFLGSLFLNCVPSYYEGFLDMRDEPTDDKTIRKNGQLRKLGFYSLVAGYTLLIVKHRRMRR